MNPATVILDWWRNFKAYVPEELTGTGYANQEIVIPIDEYLIQGARDRFGNSPDDTVLENIPTQRGWLLSVLQSETPKHGYVKLSEDKLSLIYTPRSNYVGDDCFSFRLTNGTQASDLCRVTLTVSEYYTVNMVIQKPITEDVYKFTASYTKPDSYAKPLAVTMVWYWTRPVAVWNETRQAYEIFTKRDLVQQSSHWFYSYYSFYPTIVLRNVLQMEFPMDDKLAGYDGTSNRYYVPKMTRGVIECEMRLHYNTYNRYAGYPSVNMSKWTELNYATEDNWWESGTILAI